MINEDRASGPPPSEYPGEPSASVPAGIDFSLGLRSAGGNEALLSDLLADFQNLYADTANRIRASLANGATEEATRQAHTIKGLAGTLGGISLMAVALELEAACRHGNTTEELIDHFAESIKAFITAIENRHKAEKIEDDVVEIPRKEAARATPLALIDEISNLIEQMDPAVSGRAEALMMLLRDGPQMELSKTLTMQTGFYEFDAAALTLAELRASIETSSHDC